MTALPFIVLTLSTGLASLVLRNEPRRSAAVGVGGLVAGLLAALLIVPDAATSTPLGPLAVSADAVTVLGTMTAAALLLVVIAAAGGWVVELPGAALLMLGGGALTLTATAPAAALMAASMAGVAAVVAVGGAGTDRTLLVGTRELRVGVAAAAVVLVAMAIVDLPGSSDGPDAVAGGVAPAVAFLVVAAATAVRIGAIPFHLRAARLAAASPGLVLPLALVWAPGLFALVGFRWAADAFGAAAITLPLEQTLVVLVAGTSILFGTAAALLHDDLEHVVAYAFIADAGVALLVFASFGDRAVEAGLAWLLIVVVGRSAFAAWASAVRGTFGADRAGDLAGWARRGWPLGLALVLIGLATVGWPGSAAWEARRSLTALVTPTGLGWLLLAGSVAGAAIYARLLAIGLRRPGPAAVGRPPWRPAWRRGRRRDRHDVLEEIVAGWTLNRTPVTALATVAFGILALLVGSGATTGP